MQNLSHYRCTEDAAILIDMDKLAELFELPADTVKAIFDTAGRRIVNDGTGRLYVVKKEVAA